MNPKNKKINTQKHKTTEIVSVVAHQLKSPMAVIKGYLEALCSGDCGKITPAQKEYLSDALENVERIFDFIETLLDVSRIEDKKFGIKLEPVALEKIISGVLNNLSHWIEANNCEVLFKKPQKAPKALTNPLRIRQVIQNFIANAVVYKEKRGKVEISLKKAGNNVVFACKDNGVGIPREDFKKVFSKFYRSEKAMNLDPSGSGLGLFISKAVVESSKGKVWFKKNKDRGMTFYFSLPSHQTRTGRQKQRS